MLKFISFVLFISFTMVLWSVNLHAAEANDAEMHYFRGMEYYVHKQHHDATMEFGKAIKLEPNYAEAQCDFKVVRAKLGIENRLERDNSQASTASLEKSVGYGCLGCLGCLGGYLGGCLIGGCLTELPPLESRDINTRDSAFYSIAAACSILGAGIGAYWGSKDVDSMWERAHYIGGAVIFTGVAYYALSPFWKALMHVSDT